MNTNIRRRQVRVRLNRDRLNEELFESMSDEPIDVKLSEGGQESLSRLFKALEAWGFSQDNTPTIHEEGIVKSAKEAMQEWALKHGEDKKPFLGEHI